MITGSISVLGAGSWGTALAIRLAANSNDVCLWGHEPTFMEKLSRERQNRHFLPKACFPDKLRVETDLSLAVHHSRDLLIAVPSHAFRDVLTKALPSLTARTRVVWATKGLENGTGKFGYLYYRCFQ